MRNEGKEGIKGWLSDFLLNQWGRIEIPFTKMVKTGSGREKVGDLALEIEVFTLWCDKLKISFRYLNAEVKYVIGYMSHEFGENSVLEI